MLQRWIAARKVGAPRLRIRRGRAVRLWTKRDVQRLRPVQGRPLLQGSLPEKEPGVMERDAPVLHAPSAPLSNVA
jgi:hypothetical protein